MEFKLWSSLWGRGSAGTSPPCLGFFPFLVLLLLFPSWFLLEQTFSINPLHQDAYFRLYTGRTWPVIRKSSRGFLKTQIYSLLKGKSRLDAVAQACNPSILGCQGGWIALSLGVSDQPDQQGETLSLLGRKKKKKN